MLVCKEVWKKVFGKREEGYHVNVPKAKGRRVWKMKQKKMMALVLFPGDKKLKAELLGGRNGKM